MCIIAYKPADHIIKEPILRECFFRNPDGAGITYVHEGKIVIRKGIRNADDLVKAVGEFMDKEMVIHCRVASKGMVVNDENCHPFYIKARCDKDTGEPTFEYSVSHNGTLEWGHTGEKSDTHLFTEQFLTPMFESHPHLLTWEWGRIALERTISFGTALRGRLNKMVIMVNDRREEGKSITYILNEFEGNWNGGIWFSNRSWDKDTRPKEYYKGSEDFFVGLGKNNGQKGSVIKTPSIKADQFRWYSQPDANGWFWSYTWDAWINHKTYTIQRELSIRQSPEYTRKPGFVPVDLGGRSTLSAGEVNHMLFDIYEQLELGAGPPEGKSWEFVPKYPAKDPLAHLESSEKSLICKKAYDVMIWSGESKKTVRGLSSEEKIKDLRNWIRSLYEGHRKGLEIDGMTYVELDMWIIKEIKAGELTIDKIDAMYIEHEKALNGKGGVN